MRFNLLGVFKNYTQTNLKEMVKGCGSIAMTANELAIGDSTRYAYLPQSYCVLANRIMIDSFIADPMKSIKIFHNRSER